MAYIYTDSQYLLPLMQLSDASDESIDSYLPTDGANGRIVFIVRSLAPTTSNTTQTKCFDRLRRLASGASLDVSVDVWGDGICTHAPDIDGISEKLETITDIYSFSADGDASITPFFDVQRIDSTLSGETFERIIPPHRTLLTYEDDTLKGVFPCRIDEQTYTPSDAINRLESTADVALPTSADAV